MWTKLNETILNEVVEWFFFLVFVVVLLCMVVATYRQYPIVAAVSFAAVFLGTGLNILVRKLNGWKMPVKIFDENVRKDVLFSSVHCEMTDASRCKLFADRIRFCLGKSYYIFSIGDCLIDGGVVLLGSAVLFVTIPLLIATFL